MKIIIIEYQQDFFMKIVYEVKRLCDRLLLLDIFMCIAKNLYLCAIQFIIYTAPNKSVFTCVKNYFSAVSFSDISKGKRLYILVKTCEFIALFFTYFSIYLIHYIYMIYFYKCHLPWTLLFRNNILKWLGYKELFICI